MPITRSYDAARSVVRVVAHGAVSLDERVRFFAQLLTDSALPTHSGVLVDVSGVTNGLTADTLAAVGMLAGRVLARFSGRLAIVNATAGHVTTSHLVALLAGEHCERVRVCCSETSALAWVEA
jgi:hypothetical protein